MPCLGLARVDGALYGISAKCEAFWRRKLLIFSACYSRAVGAAWRMDCFMTKMPRKLPQSRRHPATRHAPQKVLHAAFCHFFHHLFHLQMLLQQPIDVLNLLPRATGNAFLAGTVNGLREAALARGHRIDNRHLAANFLLIAGVLQRRGIDVARL